MPLPLSEIFKDEDYRFHLTLRRGDLTEFFKPSDPALLTERKRWLERDAGPYLAGEADAGPIVTEFAALAGQEDASSLWSSLASTAEQLVALGSTIEPDFVLLSDKGTGVFRIRAGVVCFPSWWSLPEKLGLTLEETHSVVPGLNRSLGPPISTFLQKLKPGSAFERANWGLAATDELNLHPTLLRPRLELPLDVSRLWVRIEDQILGALPRTAGIVFGIRLRILPISRFLGDPALGAGLHRALATMSEPLAAYKGLTPIRTELLAALGAEKA